MKIFKKIIDFFENRYDKACFYNEDKVVINFLNEINYPIDTKYLEVGSGTGRFPLILKEKYKNLSIKCLEINNDLVELTKKNGLDSVQGNVLDTGFQNETFDIVHCSHVIEHLGYPEITCALDEIFRITKKNGYVIIRSPLMHPGFYFDIDHVRPYPPESILIYFNNIQQQKKGECKVKKIKIWYRRGAFSISFIQGKIKQAINFILRILWTYIRFPFSSRNGYIIILQKI